MKCEVKVKVKPIRCFHVKSRTLTSWCQLVRARRKEAYVQREPFLNAEA